MNHDQTYSGTAGFDTSRFPAAVILEQAHDPAWGMKGAPPAFGKFVVPHIFTVQGRASTVSKVYRPHDEAIRDSLDNARFMRNEVSIMECVEARQRAVSLLNWHLVPEDDKDQKQRKMCAELTTILERSKLFLDYRFNLMHAIWYGKYGVQHRYARKKINGQFRTVLHEWVPLNGDKIVFRYDDATGQYKAGQVGIRIGAGYQSAKWMNEGWQESHAAKIQPTDQGLAYFLDDWERDLIAIHKHIIEDGVYEDPLSAGSINGVGIRSRIYATWLQMQEATCWLMEYLERSAFGIELWKYPSGNPKAEAAARKAAEERIGGGRSIVMVPVPPGDQPDVFGVEHIEPGMTGAESVKSIVVELFGHRMKRYIMGQTLTSETDATGLGSGVADLHEATWYDIIRYDARKLSETLTEELVEPLKAYNFPSFKDCHVAFVIDTETADASKKLEAWRTAYDMGLALKAQDVAGLIGASMPDKNDQVLSMRSEKEHEAELQQKQQEQQQQGEMQMQQAQAQAQGGMPGGAPGGHTDDSLVNAHQESSADMDQMTGRPNSIDEDPYTESWALSGKKQRYLFDDFEPERYVKDKSGHEHAPKGSPKGGQFVSQGGGGAAVAEEEDEAPAGKGSQEEGGYLPLWADEDFDPSYDKEIGKMTDKVKADIAAREAERQAAKKAHHEEKKGKIADKEAAKKSKIHPFEGGPRAAVERALADLDDKDLLRKYVEDHKAEIIEAYKDATDDQAFGGRVPGTGKMHELRDKKGKLGDDINEAYYGNGFYDLLRGENERYEPSKVLDYMRLAHEAGVHAFSEFEFDKEKIIRKMRGDESLLKQYLDQNRDKIRHLHKKVTADSELGNGEGRHIGEKMLDIRQSSMTANREYFDGGMFDFVRENDGKGYDPERVLAYMNRVRKEDPDAYKGIELDKDAILKDMRKDLAHVEYDPVAVREYLDANKDRLKQKMDDATHSIDVHGMAKARIDAERVGEAAKLPDGENLYDGYHAVRKAANGEFYNPHLAAAYIEWAQHAVPGAFENIIIPRKGGVAAPKAEEAAPKAEEAASEADAWSALTPSPEPKAAEEAERPWRDKPKVGWDSDMMALGGSKEPDIDRLDFFNRTRYEMWQEHEQSAGDLASAIRSKIRGIPNSDERHEIEHAYEVFKRSINPDKSNIDRDEEMQLRTISHFLQWANKNVEYDGEAAFDPQRLHHKEQHLASLWEKEAEAAGDDDIFPVKPKKKKDIKPRMVWGEEDRSILEDHGHEVEAPGAKIPLVPDELVEEAAKAKNHDKVLEWNGSKWFMTPMHLYPGLYGVRRRWLHEEHERMVNDPAVTAAFAAARRGLPADYNRHVTQAYKDFIAFAKNKRDWKGHDPLAFIRWAQSVVPGAFLAVREAPIDPKGRGKLNTNWHTPEQEASAKAKPKAAFQPKGLGMGGAGRSDWKKNYNEETDKRYTTTKYEDGDKQHGVIEPDDTVKWFKQPSTEHSEYFFKAFGYQGGGGQWMSIAEAVNDHNFITYRRWPEYWWFRIPDASTETISRVRAFFQALPEDAQEDHKIKFDIEPKGRWGGHQEALISAGVQGILNNTTAFRNEIGKFMGAAERAELERMKKQAEVERYLKDEVGHEHRGKGKGGGQFTAQPGGGSSEPRRDRIEGTQEEADNEVKKAKAKVGKIKKQIANVPLPEDNPVVLALAQSLKDIDAQIDALKRQQSTKSQGSSVPNGIGSGSSQPGTENSGWLGRLHPALAAKVKRLKPGKGRQVFLNGDECAEVLTKGRYALVSAGPREGQHMTPEEVEERTESLRQDLVAGGFQFVDTQGHYGGKEEPSYLVMVPDAHKEEAVSLGRKYGQDAVIYSDNNQNEWIYTSGPNDGHVMPGNGWQRVENTGEFFSDIETYDARDREHEHFRFRLNFEWGQVSPEKRYTRGPFGEPDRRERYAGERYDHPSGHSYLIGNGKYGSAVGMEIDAAGDLIEVRTYPTRALAYRRTDTDQRWKQVKQVTHQQFDAAGLGAYFDIDSI